MEKFTEGPWEAIGEWIRKKGKPNLIGYASASRDENGEPMRSISEQRANARLIAASPLMYEALQAVEEANQIGSWVPAINKVRAALKAAQEDTCTSKTK